MPLIQLQRLLWGVLLGVAVLVPGAGCRGRTKVIETLSDAAEARIGVMTGSIGDTIARNRFPHATVQTFDDVMDAVTAIKSGQLEAVVLAFPTGFQITKRNADLVLLAEPLDTEETAVALRKDDTALLGDVNRVIAGLRKDGTLEAMHRRWFKPELGPYEVPPMAVPTSGTPLRVGVSATREPLTFVDDRGEVSGHDGELARRIGQALGRPVEFSNMKFLALIPALQARKIDLIVTGMNASEERRKSVAFSDPYFANAQVMLVRKGGAVPPPDHKPFLTRVRESFHNNVLLERRYLLLWEGLKTTVIISLGAAVFGTLLGALVCWMRMAGDGLLAGMARAYIAVLRGTPVLVVLMMTFYVVFASVAIEPVLVAMLAFGLNFAAYAAEIFRSGLEGIDRGQSEAGIAMGFTRFQTFRFILLPQTLQRILPVYKGECISLVKMTSIVGYIAVQDLTKASDIIRSRTFDAFFPLVMVAILYFLVAWILTHLLGRLERTAGRRRKPRQEARA